jgi:hypothetical protein
MAKRERINTRTDSRTSGERIRPTDVSGRTTRARKDRGTAAIASGPDPRVPFKSQAQRRKFAELLVKGEISPQTFEEWNRETGAKKLPERVGRKRARPRAGKRR